MPFFELPLMLPLKWCLIDAQAICTKYVKKLERKLLKGFDESNISVYNMREEMDGKQDVRLLFGVSNMLSKAFLVTRPSLIQRYLHFIPRLMRTASVGWVHLRAVFGHKCTHAALDPTKSCLHLLSLSIRAVLEWMSCQARFW